MNDWKIEVEESENLLKTHGILCLINSKGDRLYVRPVNHKGDLVTLEPLTVKELKDLKIEESEHVINRDWDCTIEESAKEFTNDEVQKKFEEEQKKKAFNLTNLDDVKKAEEIARKAKEILERKEQTPEDLKSENEDLRAKLELIASKELEKKMDSLGIKDPEMRAKIREEPSRITGFEMAHKQYYPEKHDIPSGSAPLNSQQVYGNNPNIGFSSLGDMISDLKNKAREGDSQSQTILSKLWDKTVKGMKERNSTELPFDIAEKKEQKPERQVGSVVVPINAPPDPNEESELEKWGVRRKRRVEQQ